MKDNEFALHIPPSLMGGEPAIPDLWKLASTISENPELWGWQEPCSVCGRVGVVSWDAKRGYRCEAHQT